MDSKIFKKLSKVQQSVVNCLMGNRGSYIHKSNYFNHNRVVSKVPYMHEYGFETRELMQFTRPTFDVLLRKGIIQQCDIENKNIYLLAD